MPTIVSINVSEVTTTPWQNRTVETAIFKKPVQGAVKTEAHRLEGDAQADLTVHGGPGRAVYGFPAEHYPSWQEAFPKADWSWGAFGENLTVQGLLEEDVYIGDRYRCGTAELMVTQPRTPCYKFGMRVGDPAALRHMLDTGHTGYYFSISKAGTFRAGDDITRIHRPDHALPLATLTVAFARKPPDPSLLEAIVANPLVPVSWRDWAAKKRDR